MRLLKHLLLCLLAAFPGLIEGQSTVTVPQINLSGGIGCIGFPCVNTGTVRIPSDADYNMPSTLSQPFTSASSVKFTSAVSLTAPRNIIYPAGRFELDVENATSGGQTINICGPTGACVAVPNSTTSGVRVWNDGTNYIQIGTTGSGGGLSGQTSGCVPLASSATTSTGPAPICDDGTTLTFTHPVAISSSGPSQTKYVYGSSAIVPTSGAAVIGSDSNGHFVAAENGGAAAQVCTATNGICASAGGSYTLGGSVSCANLSLGSGAGSGATCTGVTGLDGSHFIEITTGTTPTVDGVLFTFTFSASRGHGAYCLFQPVSLGRYSSKDQVPTIPTFGNATYYEIGPGSVPLDSSTIYEFNVSCP